MPPCFDYRQKNGRVAWKRKKSCRPFHRDKPGNGCYFFSVIGKEPEKQKTGSGWFSRYLHFSLVYKIMIGFGIGAILGLILGPKAGIIYPLGEIFIRLLKMIVMPIILSTLIIGAASINPRNLGRIGGKIIIYYIVTSAFAVVIGLLLANFFDLGSGLSIRPPAGYSPDLTAPSIVDVFLGIIPTNPFGSLSKTEPLPIIFFALIFGVGLAHLRHSHREKMKKSADVLLNFFQATTEIIFMITRGVLEYAPIGILAIMARVVGENGAAVFGPFVKLIAIAYLGMLMHIFLVYGGLLLLFRINPWRFFQGIKEALVTAYVSRTSSGTLPVSIMCAEENLGVSNEVCSFTLPLGATINMDGTALYIAIEAIFAAHMFGIDLSLSQQITILITVILASIGTAGVPSASLVMLGGVLKAVKLPLSVIPIFAGFDPLCDMMRTLTNVTGDLTGTVIVAKSEGKLDTNTGTWVGKDVVSEDI